MAFRLLGFILFIGLTSSVSLAQVTPNLEGKVTKVVDGDTFDIGKTRIRVWGIDTPEMSTQAGMRAKAWMINLIDGKELQCKIQNLDAYGRTVAQCHLDGKDIAVSLLEAKQARQFCRYSKGYYNGIARQSC